MTEKWRGLYEFLGLAMLAASLVFVAYQMQQDRKIAIAELNTTQLEMYASRMTAGLGSDAYLAMHYKFWATKAWDPGELSELEIAATEMDALLWLTYGEMTYENYREGLVTEESWLEFEQEITVLLSVPAYRAVFEKLWKQAPSDFTRVADEVLNVK
ncbi:MAG: hypothetical protein ACI9BW_003813 [Gammaproteobacteria bacterium]|jgi:hypothetical protein